MVTAADKVGVNRNTIRRWVRAGKLQGKPGIVGNRPVVLVAMDEVRKLAAGGVKPGRPKKKGR
jgi:hypothetical protein